MIDLIAVYVNELDKNNCHTKYNYTNKIKIDKN